MLKTRFLRSRSLAWPEWIPVAAARRATVCVGETCLTAEDPTSETTELDVGRSLAWPPSAAGGEWFGLLLETCQPMILAATMHSTRTTATTQTQRDSFDEPFWDFLSHELRNPLRGLRMDLWQNIFTSLLPHSHFQSWQPCWNDARNHHPYHLV